MPMTIMPEVKAKVADRVKSDIVGRHAGEAHTVATLRRILAYAAAIDASDHCYTDDLRPEGVVAPPPFAICLEWPVVSGWWGTLGGFSNPERAFESVHVFQDSHFHGLIKPGQELRTTGHIAAVRPTSAGAYVAVKLETVDVASLKTMVTSWWGGIFLGMSVEGPARETEALPRLRQEPGLPAGPAEREIIPIDRLYPHIYTECSQIWNPIHTEQSFARRSGLEDIILHGSATWAMSALRLVRRYAGSDPARLKRIAVNFKGAVVPGKPIVLEHRSDPDLAGAVVFAVRNAAGELAITHGIAEFE
ncbi:MaoC/PaaZ C-terminal domain-containing protein [Pseudochelatococcus sp. B33]